MRESSAEFPYALPPPTRCLLPVVGLVAHPTGGLEAWPLDVKWRHIVLHVACYG